MFHTLNSSVLLQLGLPASVDDPNVDSLEPFRVAPDQLPEEVRGKLHTAHEELGPLGFHSPVCYWIHDAKHETDIYQAVYLHHSGQAMARIQLRAWHVGNQTKESLFPAFLTHFTDETCLISTASEHGLPAPPSCSENRIVGANVTELWNSHQDALQEQMRSKLVCPIRDEDELLGAVESHHAAVRDSHVAQSFFVPMPEDEDQAVLEAAQWAAEGISADTLAILNEIEILQNKRSGWGAGVMLLLVSVGLFFALGAAVWPWGFVAMVLPILFFHELGHFAAMRVFRYSNVKMFFIPLLGAAVSGRHYNVPGWKKVIVSLAGPLPGIFVGAGLGIAAAYFHIDWLHHMALLAIGLNGFNLLPILPLDGGWVVHALLFSRHYILDAGFRLVAVAAILAGAYFSGSRFLFFFGFVMAVGLPMAFRMAGVVSTIRRRGISTASPDDQSIPPRTAEAIVAEIRQRCPQGFSNKTVAQLTLQAFEALNARPPGILATLLLGGAYLGSFLFAFVALGLLAVGMPMFARPDLSPEHPIEVGQIDTVGQDRDAELPENGVTIVATFRDVQEAAAEFERLQKDLPEDATLVRFGQSLLLGIPLGERGTLAHWESRFTGQATDVFNSVDSFLTGFSVAATAPSEDVAAQIQAALETYQTCSTWIAPNPPWHPDALPTPEQRHAREIYVDLTEAEKIYDDPRYERLSKQLDDELEEEGEEPEGDLWKELDALGDVIRDERFDNMLREASEPADRELIQLYRRRPVLDYESEEPIEPDVPVPEAVREARKKASEEYQEELRAWQGELAGLLGGMAREPGRIVSNADRFTLEGGTVEIDGDTIQMEYAELYWPVDAAPALIRWLDEQGCTEMKYSFFGLD